MVSTREDLEDLDRVVTGVLEIKPLSHSGGETRTSRKPLRPTMDSPWTVNPGFGPTDRRCLEVTLGGDTQAALCLLSRLGLGSRMLGLVWSVGCPPRLGG